MIRFDFDALFADQLARWPGLTAQDLVKALYQGVYGCGHFVDEAGRKYLEDELAALDGRSGNAPFVEGLGPNYCRVYIARLAENGLSPDTLFTLFRLSSLEPAGSTELFREGLDRLEAHIVSGDIPLPKEPSLRFIADYRAAGCPATHHSEEFRSAYAPAYRVVSRRMCEALPLVCAIDRKLAVQEQVCVAIEGGSASGKTSLGALLERIYDCNLFHMDDFFLQPHQRTPERFAQPGGNVDYERFEAEVMTGVRSGAPFEYRKFDCSVMALGETVSVSPKRLTIVEGAYSMHPALRGAYHVSAFLDSDPEVQRARILRRNGESMLQRFVNEWIPLEHVYFEKTGAREACGIVLPPPAE